MESNELDGQRRWRLPARTAGAAAAVACIIAGLGVVVVSRPEPHPGAAPAAEDARAEAMPAEGGGEGAGEPAPPVIAAAPDTAAQAAEPVARGAIEGADDASSSRANGAAADGDGGLPPPPARPAPPPDYGPPVPPEERVPKPAAVRGIYLNAWAAGSRRRSQALIELAETTEINSFVIDVKDATGYVSYRTRSELARTIGADREIRIANIRGLLDELRARRIYPIARIVVFKDPLLAERRPDLAIQREDGSVWVDHHGEKWVDPYNREIWDYAVELAREAVELGFSEVQWDYVRFPDVPVSYMREAVYPAQAGRTRSQAIREFLEYSREKLKDLGVPVTADVFGLTVSAGDDMGIGQKWDDLVDVTDVLLPMVYPSHYARGSYGIAYPNGSPYRTVKTAMEHALRRTPDGEGIAAIRPWLQDFTLGSPRYDAAHVRAQIQAVYDVGLTEWILWNPGSRYTAAALAPEGGPAPDLPIPDPPVADSVVRARSDAPARPDTAIKLLGEPVRPPARPDTVSKLLGEPVVRPPVRDTLRR